MDPKPFMIDGIMVVADGLAKMVRRIENRRNRAATSIRAFELDDLMSSTAWNVDELLREGTAIRMVPCTDSSSFAQMCVQRRGRPHPETGLPPTIDPVVCLDNVPLFGGLDQLPTYPLHEFFAVEVYARGRVIMAYTHWFMQQVARRPVPLVPYSPGFPPLLGPLRT